MFLCKNKKYNVYPCKPQFYYIKGGLRGIKIIWVCFRDGVCSVFVYLFYFQQSAVVFFQVILYILSFGGQCFVIMAHSWYFHILNYDFWCWGLDVDLIVSVPESAC